MSEKQKKIQLCSFIRGLCSILFYPQLASSFLKLPGGTYLNISVGGEKARRPSSGVLMGGGKGRAGRERGARQTREVGSGEKGGERGARGPRRPASWPPCLPGSSASRDLCRQGTSLLVCVLAFVHSSVLCMIFVR